jgi:hypothetical protein
MTEIPNDETEDVYKLLRQNNICFKSHVEVLLKKLGFMCITTMSMITDVCVLEKTVQSHFASEARMQVMSADEKLRLFGDVCCFEPQRFSFMPGEVFSIIAAADKCKKILSEREAKLSKTASGRKRPAASSTITQAVAEIQQPTIQPSRRKGPNKMIVHYVDKWLRNTTYKLKYNLEDCEISEDTRKIVCKLYPTAKSFTVYTDSMGCWKMTSFVSHLKKAHSCGNDGASASSSLQPSTSHCLTPINQNRKERESADDCEVHESDEEIPAEKRQRIENSLLLNPCESPLRPLHCTDFQTPGIGVPSLSPSPVSLTRL